jgi:Raf kinase inhibitor-like YbhB/YbcL family protein
MTNIMFDEDSKAVDYKRLKVTSTAFEDSALIPKKYTCEGENVNPPLDIEFIPEETLSLALVVDDPDAPSGDWVHWIVWNIPVTHHIKEGEIHGVQGLNDFHTNTYMGPAPPSGTHHYFFKAYALNALLDLPKNTTKNQLEKHMSKCIIGFGELVGLFSRETNRQL